MSRTIKLTQNQWAVVDNEDFEWLNQWKWYALWHPHTKSFRVVRVSLKGEEGKQRTIYMHRVIMNAQPGQQVDHISHDTLNNCKVNLRCCTNAENHYNMRARTDGTSRFKGVSFDKRRCKWRAYIVYNGRQTHLGRYADEEKAARVYDTAATKHFGSFAKLNFTQQQEQVS